MQQILELIHTEGSSEVWRPVSQAAHCMQFMGSPQVGDFMIEREGHVHFVRPEPKRVRVKAVTGDQLQIDLQAQQVPNWFAHLMHTHQIRMQDGRMCLNGQELKAGVDVVFDGQTARIEDPNVETVTHH